MTEQQLRRALILACVVAVALLLLGWPSISADVSSFFRALTRP